MKRMIITLGVGWALIYATNHLLLPAAPTESKVAMQSEQISTSPNINSWGPYLPHVKHPVPNNMAQRSLNFPRAQEPAAANDEVIQSSSRDITDHAEAVASEDRTLQVARVKNPATTTASQRVGNPLSLQDLKPNSQAIASEERTVQVTRLEKQFAGLENSRTSAVRRYDGIQSSRDITEEAKAVASVERTSQEGVSTDATTGSIVRVEEFSYAPESQHQGIQSTSEDTQANAEKRTSRVARVEHRPIASQKNGGPKSRAATARVAEVTGHPNPLTPGGSAHHRRGVGLFMFGPPGF